MKNRIKESLLNMFILANSEETKIRILEIALNLDIKHIIKSDIFFDKFRMVWNEKKLNIEYVKNITNIKNIIRRNKNIINFKKHSETNKGVNYFGN